MNQRLMAAAALFLLASTAIASLPSGAAQQTDLATDGAGDVTANGDGQTTAVPGFDAIDLAAARITETEDLLTFEVDLAGDAKPFIDTAAVNVFLTHRGTQFRVETGRYGDGNSQGTWGELHRFDGASWLQEGDLSATLTGNTIAVDVPRDDLRDAMGATPAIGDTLFDIYVTSEAAWTGIQLRMMDQDVTSPLTLNDRMPDNGGVDYAIQQGLEQVGSVRLGTDTPMRLSNGEATTFVYTLQATASEAGRYELSSHGEPRGWSVRLPVAEIRLTAGEVVDVPVVISTPFAHRHGATELVRIDLTGPGGVGRVEIGIHYPEVPQPAGHHNTVFLHVNHGANPLSDAIAPAAPTINQDTWMNAMDADPLDDGQPLFAYLWTTGADGGHFQWRTTLEPGLGMGLHFIQGDGALAGTITSPLALPGATAEARLVYLTPDDSGSYPYRGYDAQVIGTAASGAPVDLMPGDTLALPAVIVMDPSVGVLPYTPGANLALEIDLFTTRPTTFTSADVPTLAPGAHMVLPLQDYADPVDDVFGGLIDLAVDEPSLAVAPGRAVTFDVTITNHQGNGGDFVLSLSGDGADWATVTPATTRIDAHQTQHITVTIAPPADATGNADVVLQVTGETPQATGLLRLVAAIDPDAGGEAAPLDDGGKESPGAGALAALAIIAGLAMVARRRLDR